MRLLILIFGLTILILDSFACECIPILTLEEHFRKADVVFYGKVKSINDRQVEGFKDTMHFIMDSTYTKKGGYHPTIKIKNVFKGKINSESEIELKSIWGLCDVFFENDSEYIVFGYFDNDGKIQTSICTPTTMLTDKELLKRIERIK